MSRRTLLKGGGAAVAGLSVLRVAGPAHAFPGGPGDEVIPWLDQPPPAPFPGDPQFLKWEELDSYFTDPEHFFIPRAKIKYWPEGWKYGAQDMAPNSVSRRTSEPSSFIV